MAFMPVKLTMRPQPFSSMPGKQARDSHTEASRSTEMMRRHSASLISRNGLLGRSAALLSSTSTAPNCLTAASAVRWPSSGLPTSPMTPSVLAPRFSASWATLSQAARSLEPLRTTSKPSSARPSTQARPILRPAPVINAVLRDAIFYSPAPIHSRRRHVEAKTIPLGQRAARVWTGGSGEAIVLLHGGWAGAEPYWSTVTGELERSHQVVAPELPGIGAPGELLPSFGAYAAWLAARLDPVAR